MPKNAMTRSGKGSGDYFGTAKKKPKLNRKDFILDKPTKKPFGEKYKYGGKYCHTARHLNKATHKGPRGGSYYLVGTKKVYCTEKARERSSRKSVQDKMVKAKKSRKAKGVTIKSLKGKKQRARSASPGF